MFYLQVAEVVEKEINTIPVIIGPKMMVAISLVRAGMSSGKEDILVSMDTIPKTITTIRGRGVATQ